MVKVRCIWHIITGAVAAWVAPIAITIGFVAYQYLEYKKLSFHQTHDNSYLDVYEYLVAFVISAVVRVILGYFVI